MKTLLAACVVCTLVVSVQAEGWIPAGPGALGMGGAEVALPGQPLSAAANPAFLAEKKQKYSVLLPITFQLGVEGDIVEAADKLINDFDDSGVKASFDNLKANSTNPAADVANIVNFLSTRAKSLDKPGQGLLASIQGKLDVFHRGWGLSAGTRQYAGATVIFDSNFNFSATDGGSLIKPGAVKPATIADTTVSDTALVSDIATKAAVSSGTDLASTKIQTLVNSIKTKNGESSLSDSSKSLLISTIKSVNQSNVPGAQQASSAGINNNTGLELRYLDLREASLGYGFSFDEGRFLVAPALKVMTGKAVFSRVTVADATSESKNIGDELRDAKNGKSSSDFSADLGLVWKPRERLTLGLVGRDLTSPSFKTPSGGKIKLDAGVRAGAAFAYSLKPGLLGSLALDADVVRTNSGLLMGADQQQVGLGLSQNLSRWFALRLGASRDLASLNDGWSYGAGLGLRVSHLYLDVAGAISSDKVTVDGDDFPARGATGIMLGWNMEV